MRNFLLILPVLLLLAIVTPVQAANTNQVTSLKTSTYPFLTIEDEQSSSTMLNLGTDPEVKTPIVGEFNPILNEIMGMFFQKPDSKFYTLAAYITSDKYIDKLPKGATTDIIYLVDTSASDLIATKDSMELYATVEVFIHHYIDKNKSFGLAPFIFAYNKNTHKFYTLEHPTDLEKITDDKDLTTLFDYPMIELLPDTPGYKIAKLAKEHVISKNMPIHKFTI